MEYDRISGNLSYYNVDDNNGWEDGEYVGVNGDGDDRNHTSSSTNEPGVKVFSISSPSTSSSSSSPPHCIQHHVTKFDTLAGIAIRYGVEIGDIKKMNALVTDLQMFGLKTLQIPLPGKHPPSPCLPNGHTSFGQNERTPTRTRTDFLQSFHSLRLTPERRVSSAMSSLQGYYGLSSGRHLSEAREMAGYNRGSGNGHENELFMTSSSSMNPPLSVHRKSRSVANGFNSEDSDPPRGNDNGTNVNKFVQKLSWRRLKSEADFSRTPEKLLKEENGSGGWFSLITGKSLALRTKAASRTNLVGSETEANGFPTSLGVVTEASSAVRKSSSTSSLQDQDNGGGTLSIWSSLKPDIQAALGKPIFDGLSNPITGRKTKTALD